MKRIIDLFITLVALIVLLPVFIITALLIIRDGGPALFTQVRVGRHDKPFKIYKFRSMVVNAEALGGFATTQGDSRITTIGKFIRRTSIDELPQLINVLKGDMSLVGPRPNVPAQKLEYQPADWAKRHSLPPGITGLAQATLRSQASFEQRLALDLNYVNNQSLFLDFKIILLTLKSILDKKAN